MATNSEIEVRVTLAIDIPSNLRGGALRRGTLLFLILALGGLTFNFVRSENREIPSLVHSIRWEYAVVILGCVAVDWLLGAYRLYIFGKVVAPQTSIWDYIRAGLANIFAAGLTPSSTGGGPAQIYIMQRAGVPMSACLALSIINLLSTLLFFFLGVCCVLILDPGIYTGGLNILMKYGFIAFGLVIIGIGIVMLKPEWSLRILWSLNYLISRLSQRIGSFLGKQLTRLDALTHEYKGHLIEFVLKRPNIVLKSLISTVLLYFNKFMIAYFIVMFLGIQAPFWNLVFVQVVQYFIIYFAPTPGASGVAEISSSELMSAIIPAQETAYFALIWRVFTLYLALIAGCIVVLRQLSHDLATGSLKPKEEVVKL